MMVSIFRLLSQWMSKLLAAEGLPALVSTM